MKRMMLTALLAAIAVIAGAQPQIEDWAKFSRYQKANEEVTVSPRVVFMGDSITDFWVNADPDFFTSNNFLGRGISGQTTSHMLVRFRRDVIDHHPRYVVILAGTNDIAKNLGDISLENTLGNIISMCELAKANRIKPIICSVLPCNYFYWRPEVKGQEQEIMKLNALLEEYAKSAKIPYVNYHTAMKDAENGLPKKYADDGCHPNKEGYAVMKKIILGYLTEVYAIPDSKTPRTMSPAIFSDVPEGLISELGVEDGIPSSLCSFLMIKDGKKLLFDSGNGVEDSQLIPTLEVHGYKPEDIDYVFITHLHGDHIGGMVKDGKAVFGNATVYLNKDEYDGAGNVDESPMGTAYGERIILFTDADVLPCGVEAIKAYGHTPGHTMYRIGNIVIAGDIMHGTALQLVNPESCARFDRDRTQAVESRQKAIQTFKEEGLKVYGMHFPEPYYIQF